SGIRSCLPEYCGRAPKRTLWQARDRSGGRIGGPLCDQNSMRVSGLACNFACAPAAVDSQESRSHSLGQPANHPAVATEFDGYIRDLLAQSRGRAAAEDADAMARLLNERLNDRSLTDGEIVSILRNWTVGELSTISACVGILTHYLAEHEELQRQLRETPSLLPNSIDEILRIHPPLISSRRKTTQSVAIDGCLIPAGERVTIMWASANRDEHVFGDPDEFRPDRDPAQNLLYGAGIHVCPGAPLARLELRVLLEELLRRSRLLVLSPGKKSVRAVYPGRGFSSLPVRIDWAV